MAVWRPWAARPSAGWLNMSAGQNFFAPLYLAEGLHVEDLIANGLLAAGRHFILRDSSLPKAALSKTSLPMASLPRAAISS
jgi:hypothetical protein